MQRRAPRSVLLDPPRLRRSATEAWLTSTDEDTQSKAASLEDFVRAHSEADRRQSAAHNTDCNAPRWLARAAIARRSAPLHLWAGHDADPALPQVSASTSSRPGCACSWPEQHR